MLQGLSPAGRPAKLPALLNQTSYRCRANNEFGSRRQWREISFIFAYDDLHDVFAGCQRRFSLIAFCRSSARPAIYLSIPALVLAALQHSQSAHLHRDIRDFQIDRRCDDAEPIHVWIAVPGEPDDFLIGAWLKHDDAVSAAISIAVAVLAIVTVVFVVLVLIYFAKRSPLRATVQGHSNTAQVPMCVAELDLDDPRVCGQGTLFREVTAPRVAAVGRTIGIVHHNTVEPTTDAQINRHCTNKVADRAAFMEKHGP